MKFILMRIKMFTITIIKIWILMRIVKNNKKLRKRIVMFI